MSTPRPYQKNAADPKQGRYADRQWRRRRDLFARSLKAVLSTPEGRLVFGELLEEAGLDESAFEHSGSEMYFNAGQRHFGARIKAALLEADEDLFDVLERERRARRRAEDRETEAVQTPRADEGASAT